MWTQLAFIRLTHHRVQTHSPREVDETDLPTGSRSEYMGQSLSGTASDFGDTVEPAYKDVLRTRNLITIVETITGKPGCKDISC
jgi:hypothetical protein